MRIYLDAAPVISTVEHIEPYATRVDERLLDRAAVRVASDLTRRECRVKPIREAAAELLEQFDLFFQAAVREIVPLSKEVMGLSNGNPGRVRVSNAGCHPLRCR